MKKKEYIKPATCIYAIQTESLLDVLSWGTGEKGDDDGPTFPIIDGDSPDFSYDVRPSYNVWTDSWAEDDDEYYY